MIRWASSFLAVCVLLSVSLNAFAQWKTLDPQFPKTLSIYFTSEDTGYATWDKILKTTDGGVTFTPQLLPASPDTASLRSMSWPTSNIGYVGGEVQNHISGAYYGVMLKTTNAGLTWKKLPIDSTFLIWQIVFPTPSVGYAIEGSTSSIGNRLAKTIDGGISWTVAIPDSGHSLPAMNFRNVNEGFVAQHQNAGVSVAFTSDGLGSTTLRLNGMKPPAPDVVFAFVPTADTAWLASADGFLYRTTNLGLEWRRIFVDNEPYLMSLSMSGNTGFEYSAQATKIMNYTTDFGQTWNGTPLPDSGGTVKGLATPSTQVAYGIVSLHGNYQLVKWHTPQSVHSPTAASEMLNITYSIDAITLSYSPSNSARRLKVYDLLGREQLSRELAPRSNSISISRSALKTGVYFARADWAISKFVVSR